MKVLKRRRVALGVCAAMLIALTAAACSDSVDGTTSAAGKADANGVRTLKFGITSQVALTGSLSNYPLYFMRMQGFDAQNGIKLDFVSGNSVPLLIQQVISGDTAMTLSNISDVLKSRVKGADLIHIDSEDIGSLGNYIIGGKGVTGWQDVVGKTVNLGSPGDLTTKYWNEIAPGHGIDLGKMKIIYTGISTQRLAALQSGAVQAALLTQPSAQKALDAGLVSLADVTDTFSADQFAGYGVAVSAKWAADNEATVVGYIKAYVQTVTWMYDPANKATILAELEKAKFSSASAATLYDRSFVKQKFWYSDAKYTKTQLDNVVAAVKEIKAIPNDYVVDYEKVAPSTYVDKAVAK